MNSFLFPDSGNFSFGSCTKFKSQTIVDFIETAVEHSRSGRYLFFLHRRPILGPMRVQLLHPVSRFKHIQSLQHLCRFEFFKIIESRMIIIIYCKFRIVKQSMCKILAGINAKNCTILNIFIELLFFYL